MGQPALRNRKLRTTPVPLPEKPGPVYVVTPQMRKQADKTRQRASATAVSARAIKRKGGFGIA